MIFDFRWFLPKTCFRHRKAPKFDAFFSWGYEKMNQKQNTKHPLSSRGMFRGCEIKCSTRKWWAKNNSDCSSPHEMVCFFLYSSFDFLFHFFLAFLFPWYSSDILIIILPIRDIGIQAILEQINQLWMPCVDLSSEKCLRFF